eukprot:15336685-Ditylum_brightwellii.AAC.1
MMKERISTMMISSSNSIREKVAEKENKEVEAESATLVLPKWGQWAVLHPDIDLSGGWKVEAEAWWESQWGYNGNVHISWLRGGKKYGVEDFESRRYLKNDGKILVCESKFHLYDK